MREIKNILKTKAEEVETNLEKLMNLKEETAPRLTEAMKYTLLSGGKRIRPVLSLMTAELLDGNYEAALKAGSALEMIHSYSLIHDDLPAMDDDQLRRGKKTNHLVFGEAEAILAGDALLTYAFEVLSELELDPAAKIKIIANTAKYSGQQGMVGGQILDLEGENKKLSLAEMQKVHKAKTGALIKAAVLNGVYCSDYSEKEEQALLAYAENIGVLFQIVDDLLDLTGETEKMGKVVGRDEELNKSTYPKLLGLNAARAAAQEHADQAKTELNIFGDKAEDLKALVDYILKRQH
ncbi:Octaprenyl-diphosphate synthase / Dimethylallyltransferase / Geranyltranstransferase (farnesyldiphosphate synthase) / Geranylgeranyl pyrophosphate synthetase [Halanaerobium saccharolyticum subsp. saccharolyticum DSM 6643]|uniref:Farnesyl diphosphate synthase n=1 Tax=Halanaerobium saccharolyticum subsp. saccharolyticum DSM 6643 TaxID=1293054 RepID=M5E0S8_9FIRM|nr:farnesyl diphosphate synthase [Halanaerobium saccharolyticum]CCU79331.1 Octaprenyl-diphosphate synthase / Dimethylallyltransferase / Geranyltranstransferase (farnesyldiphosphate synthase) / Geranylgeranyl pyrophosphate synthetase [Halanaerobium saccharolyticum subsp. saccharolyticum DSM 6643]